MGRVLDMLRTVWGSGADHIDGYGQSLVDDIKSASRFRTLKKDAIVWQRPDTWSGDLEADFPILDRFGDVYCWQHADGEDRVIIDRIWHGWPDPPEYAVFAFDAARQIMWATDFDQWPARWVKPPVRASKV
jgi:hypothetical protein